MNLLLESVCNKANLKFSSLKEMQENFEQNLIKAIEIISENDLYDEGLENIVYKFNKSHKLTLSNKENQEKWENFVKANFNFWRKTKDKQHKKTPITTLLIDFDQTMRATGGPYGHKIFEAIKEIAHKRGFSDEEIDSNYNLQLSLHQFGMFNQVMCLMDYNQEMYDDFCKEVFDLLDYSQVLPDPEMLDLLLKVSEKYEIYCATNNHRIHVDKGFHRMFGKGINDIPQIKLLDINNTKFQGRFWGKQTPHALDAICQVIGKNIDECVLIDDNNKNLILANKIGMKTVYISKDYPLVDYLRSLL